MINKKNPKRKTRQSLGTKKLLKDNYRDTTTDDVIRDLLSLFNHLGLDVSRFIKKVIDVDVPVVDARRPYSHLSAIGDLLTIWHQDPHYLDDVGNPIAIRMRGTRRSFCELAEKAAPNMSPKQLLLELTRLRAVELDEHGAIRAKTRSLPAYQDKQLAVAHTLNALRGFIKTLSHNLNSGPSNSDQLFHRIAWNGEFDRKDIPRLKIWLKRNGQSLLESTDNWMINKSRNHGLVSKRHNRFVQVSVGVYLSLEDL